MADEQSTDQLEEASEEPKAKSGSGGGKKILLIAGLVLLVVLGSMGGAFVIVTMMGDGSTKQVSSAEEHSKDDPAKSAEEHGHDGSDAEQTISIDPNAEPIYYTFDPPFTVNFDARGQIRFLQIGLVALTRSQQVVTAIERHMPVIRNNLVMLFSSQEWDAISSRLGRERVRAMALSEIQSVLKEEIGVEGVEQVYFTSFVAQ